jgi:para-nitrobenzyl esterase
MAQTLGAASIAELRAKPADELLKNARGPFGIIVDGWYVPEDLSLTYENHKQNDVDVLVGSNRDEGTFFSRPEGSTPSSFPARRNAASAIRPMPI